MMIRLRYPRSISRSWTLVFNKEFFSSCASCLHLPIPISNRRLITSLIIVVSHSYAITLTTRFQTPSVRSSLVLNPIPSLRIPDHSELHPRSILDKKIPVLNLKRLHNPLSITHGRINQPPMSPTRRADISRIILLSLKASVSVYLRYWN